LLISQNWCCRIARHNRYWYCGYHLTVSPNLKWIVHMGPDITEQTEQ
jgi:hypothetical protein